MQPNDGKYPRSGKVALLCEGDVAGYEADLLARWTNEHPSIGFVDIWPCGTKTAIYGVSDAIGRSVPICVIEDRDYRSIATAEKDCRGKLDDRKKRGVRIQDWRTWKRNEIENYLIEPCVIYPVFAQSFETNESEVDRVLKAIIGKTFIDQALQYVLSEFRSQFPSGEQDVGGVPRSTARPKWENGEIRQPPQDIVGVHLSNVFENSRRSLERKKKGLDSRNFIDCFNKKCDSWKGQTIDSQAWRIDWAGKETLFWLRVFFTAKIGWPEASGSVSRVPVDWESMSREEFGQKDREIERVLQPKLVSEFLRKMTDRASGLQNVKSEWKSLAADLGQRES